ncbi:MAG: deoxyhypusine synthase, partial [Candidatus Aenigmarchaeota archaeon]|nr:deoxyhypusine synthase [Candidatus Aenigmarchaeota archaeon]
DLKKVHHIKTEKMMTCGKLVEQMEKSGVMGAGKVAKATKVLEDMIRDKECTVFLGLAGAMVPGGQKQIIIDMLKDGWIDVLVTTGANLTHDLIEALGYYHYQGTHMISDEELNRKKIDRIYDVFMPDEVYQGLEKFCKKVFAKMPKEEMDIKEFLWLLGKEVPKEDSILRICAEKKIPIFCPALSDSGIGLQVWGYMQEHQIKVSAFADLKQIIDITWTSEKNGVIYIGGGVPKNYVQQALQFAPTSASYAVQITTDRPESGGSSGAELREGISWGKLDKKAKYVNVTCDATIALPLISAAVKERLEK